MTDRPDDRRTPPPPPGEANGPTPGRVLRNNNFVPITPPRTPPRQVGSFREFARRHSQVAPQGLSPPRLRRSGREHSAVWRDLGPNEIHTVFTQMKVF